MICATLRYPKWSPTFSRGRPRTLPWYSIFSRLQSNRVSAVTRPWSRAADAATILNTDPGSYWESTAVLRIQACSSLASLL